MAFGTQWITHVATVLVALALLSCKKPQLKTDAEEASLEEMEAVAAVDPDSVEGKRKAVIGRAFESLTLGSRRFTAVEIRDITDEGIVVAHAGGVDDVSWDEVPENVREEWGYDPASKSKKESLAERLSGSGLLEKPEMLNEPAPIATVEAPKKTPQLSAADRARRLSQMGQRLEAQRVGMQSLESDLSRHSIQLKTLRAEYQSVRALQSTQRSGGVRVERIGGESTVVDRRKQAGELQARIQVEEQMVAQLTKSLQAARQQYQAINAELIQLRQQ